MIGISVMQASLPSFIQGSAAQHQLHLTAFGAVRGGHLAEKVIFRVSCLAIIGGR